MLAFWLPSTDFRAEVRLFAADKQAVLPTIAYNRHVFFKEKKLIEEKKLLLIGRRRMKLEGGEKGSFLTCLNPPPPPPFPFSERILFHARPSENALNMLKNVTRLPGRAYPYDGE